MFRKKGVSPVIATVLLLVLTIVAVSILAVFVIPFVRDSVNEGGECFDVLGDLRFDDSNYNCYYDDAQDLLGRTGFSVVVANNDILGFKATLHRQGVADSYEIRTGGNASDIRNLGGQFGETFEIPTKGGTRTYVARGEFTRVEINPILRTGRICDERVELLLTRCTDSAVINNLRTP